MRLEFSLREEVLEEPEVVFHSPGYPDIVPFSISVMSLPEILAEKVRAVMTRNKARDVYDLWFLLDIGVMLNPELAARTIHRALDGIPHSLV